MADELQHEIDALAAAVEKLVDKFGAGDPDRAIENAGHALAEQSAAMPSPYRFLDHADRMEHGDTYAVRPPETPPVSAQAQPAGQEPPEQSGREMTLLDAINRGVWQLVEKGTQGTKEQEKTREEAKKTAHPLQPVFDHLGNTRIGGVAKRFAQRAGPHVRSMWEKASGKDKGRRGSILSKLPSGRGKAKSPPGPNGLGAKAPLGGGGIRGAGAAGAGEGAAGAAAGEGAGAAGAAGGAGFAVPAIGAAIAIVMAGVEVTKKAMEYAHEQEGRARELAEYSPTQAAAVAELDMGRWQRAQESGERTGKGTQMVLQSENNFEEKLQPFLDALTTIKDGVFAKILDTATAILEFLEPLLKVLEFIAKWLTDDFQPDSKVDNFADFLGRVANEQRQKEVVARAAVERLRRAQAGF